MDPKTVINELTAAGLSQTAIARAIGMAQSGVSRLASGERQRIGYAVGVRLAELHKRHMRLARKVAA